MSADEPKKIKTDKGTELEADLIFFCGGTKTNSKSYESFLDDEKQMNPVTKKVRIQDDLRVVGYVIVCPVAFFAIF